MVGKEKSSRAGTGDFTNLSFFMRKETETDLMEVIPMRIRAPPKKKDQGRKRIKRKGEGAGWGFAKQAQLPFSWKPSKQIKKESGSRKTAWHFLQARLTPSSCW